MKKETIDKALKPSQRKSISGYSAKFAHSPDMDIRAKRRNIARIVIVAAVIIALVYLGFFLTDVLIRISEVPPVDAHIFSEANTWISFLSIQG